MYAQKSRRYGHPRCDHSQQSFTRQNIHKFFNKADIRWVNLIWESHYQTAPPSKRLEGSHWWKTHLKLLRIYKESARCSFDWGDTILLWHDRWNNEALAQKFPELFSFVINGHASFKQLISSGDLAEHFHIPLSYQAYQQLLEFQNIVPQNPTYSDSLTETFENVGHPQMPIHLCSCIKPS